MRQFLELNSHTLTKAIIGVASPAAGIVTSLQAQVEWWLRVTALLCGIAVSVATLISIRRHRHKHGNHH